MLKGIDYSQRTNIRLRVRIEKANLSPSETSVSLAAWSSVWRSDPGPAAETEVPMPLDAAHTSRAFEITLVTPRDHGGADSPWPADATLWFGTHTWAPSADGPRVGGRAGCGGVHFQDLRDRLVGGKTILLKMLMSQMGIPGKGGRYRKMNVRILGFARDAAREAVRAWTCARAIGPTDFVEPMMPLHDDLMNEYVNVALFPYTDVAQSQNRSFRPSHHAIAPIHAPTWQDNVTVPGFAFWMQTGVPRYDSAMVAFMAAAAHAVLARHDWPRGIPGAAATAPDAAAEFVRVCSRQFRRSDAVYDDTFTYAVAALADTCALLAVSTFYRYDEVYRVDEHWFRNPSEQKAQTESFQDALAMAGGDCEDVGSLIHRVFRWLQLGDPRRADASRYWTQFGGWEDPVLDTMQRIAYWYVSGGTLGSVTAARFKPQPGGAPQLFINSSEDENLPVGGHMWQEAIPVVKFEALVRRMNKSGAGGRVRPEYIARFGQDYPGWIKFLPHTIGEGTGSVYPLVLPLTQYMHGERARTDAHAKHAAMIAALKKIQYNTTLLGHLQIERWSDRARPVPDARVNYFYRRATKFSTDDLALRHIPRFDFIWTRKGRRAAEQPRRRIPAIRGAFIGAGASESESESDSAGESSSSSSGTSDGGYGFFGAGFSDSESSSTSGEDFAAGAGFTINSRKKKAKKAKKAKKPKKSKAEKAEKKARKKAKKAHKEEERRAKEGEEDARDEYKKDDSLRKRVKKTFGSPLDDDSSGAGFLPTGRGLIGVPGDDDANDDDSDSRRPEWGVDMRDRVMAANLAVGDGRSHRKIALTAAPPVTSEEMASFQARIAQLAPWRQPWRSTAIEALLDKRFAAPIAEFQAEADDIVAAAAAAARRAAVPGGGGGDSVRVNVIFRRNQFLAENTTRTALDDIRHLARAGDLVRVETTFEFLEKWIYNVRVSLWITSTGYIPEVRAV